MRRWFLIHWLKWRVGWSNWRFHNCDGDIVDYKLDLEDLYLATIKDIREKAADICERFQYKYDDVSQLFDAIRSPASCYKDYRLGLLKDDCDGFHAALYHMVAPYKTTVRLVTYITEDLYKSHSVLAVRFLSGWVLFDYNAVKCFYEDLGEGICQVAASHEAKVLAWNAVYYDYARGCWKIDKELH